METKLGNVNSISDLFEVIEHNENEPGTEGWGSVIDEVWKCKLCGDTVKGVSALGACHSGMSFVSDRARDHIELHKTLNNLKISE